jgi:NADH:ubiquinone oxidoreductase subunit 6 (subunit J)
MMVEDVALAIAFWVLAATTVGASLAMVIVRGVFRAAMFLILAFVGVAGLYITLSADFLGVVQILVYAGAIAVLVVFAVMMTHDQSGGNQEGDLWLPGAIISGLLFLVSAVLISLAAWTPREPGLPGGDGNTTLSIARVLFNQYALPFEVASLLLLGAMIGAIVIARGD